LAQDGDGPRWLASSNLTAGRLGWASLLMGMGSGASTKHHVTVLPRGSADQKDHLGSADLVEGSVQWLFSVVEKEKREKEWLAAKYDEQSAQVTALQKEVTELRRELHAYRALASGVNSVEMPRPKTPMRGMAPDVIAKVPGDAVAVTTPNKTSAILSSSLQDQSNPVSPFALGKLKERRGMKTLSIETPPRAGNADAAQTHKEESKGSLESKQAEQRPPGEAVSSASVSTPGVGPRTKNTERKTGLRMMGHEGGEPGSALLRRRKEDWQVMATVLEKDDTAVEAQSPKINDLHVRASKVQDLDCPCSPKRPVRKRDDF